MTKEFSLVDSTIYELFSSTLYDGVWYAEKSQPERFIIDNNFNILLGYHPTQMLAWKDIMSPEDSDIFKEQIANFTSSVNRNSHETIRFIHKNGAVLWMQSFIYSDSNPEIPSQFIFIGFKDITQQKNEDLNIKRQQKREHEILNSSGIGTWEYNLITGEVNYNESCANIIGYSLKELQDMEGSFWEILSHPEDAKNTERLIDEHIASKSPSFESEVRIKHKDGHWVWVVDIGRVLSYTADHKPEWIGGTHYAITDRKNGELLVKHYKELLEDVHEAAEIGIWELDLKTNQITYSDEIKEIFQIPMSFDLTYDNATGFIKEGKCRQKMSDAIKNALERGINYDIEVEGITANKKSVWTRSIGISEFKNGECIRFYGFFQNIHEKTMATKELALKEELFRKTFSHAAVGMAIIDLKGNISKVNKNLCEYLGYSEKQLLQKNFNKFSHPEDKDRSNEFIDNLVLGKSESFRLDKRYIHKDDTILWGHISVSSVRNEMSRITYFVVQVQDITERKNNELLLINYKDLLERSNFVAKIGSWELDPKTQTLFWSHNLGRLLGKTDYVPHALNDSIIDYILVENQEQVTSLLDDALQNGTNFDLEIQLKTATGLRWMRMIGISDFKDGICKSVHGLIQDIDEFKSVQLEILVREEEFRQTFWHAPIGMALMDLNGKLFKVNPGMCETFGYTENEMLTMDKNEMTHPDDSKTTNKFIQKLLSGQSESFRQEKRYFHKNKNLIWAILSMSAVKNDKGQTTHFVCQVNDITDKKLLTESLKEHNNRLQNYAHIVSHNLRSHTGNLAMLLELSEINHKSGFEDELFDHIKSASDNMSETVNHLSQIIEIQNLIKNTLVPQNLKKRVKKSLQSVQTTINQINGEVVTKVKKDLMVYGITSYVDSIILNILTNAIKYRSPQRLLKINIRAKKVNGFTTLSISDNGLGIDLEKHSSKMFGMYKTFHDHKNARGIGLFISKNQIEAMNGTIEVQSQVDVGSTFTIYFKDEDN